MARRIDIELTSRHDDGTWTWRAPGARQPRGALDGGLLPDSSKVGDVLRADAEFEIDGIVITSVQRPKTDSRSAKSSERIELLSTEAPSGVSVELAPGSRRRSDEGRERGPGRTAGRTGRTGRERSRERTAGSAGDVAPGRGGPVDRSSTDRGGPDGARRDRRPRQERGGRGERSSRTVAGEGPDRAVGGGRPDRAAGGDRRTRAERPERPRRLQPVATHRNAALAELRPEQVPVAEQLLRGGIPAVRQAIAEQNSRARAEGRAEVSPEPLLAMAEQLLPRMNLASWKDRAVVARAAGKDAPLREVRSVVTASSTLTLDDEGRELVTTLRDSLQSRVTALREEWLGRITGALDAGRISDALRVSARPPEPTARVPADLAKRLSDAAGNAMGPDVAEAQWLSLLAAAMDSPVRRTVKPVGLPRDAGTELLNQARRAAGLIPELARLLGLPIPPPPGPRRPSASAARGS
jgi:hypothetical protein